MNWCAWSRIFLIICVCVWWKLGLPEKVLLQRTKSPYKVIAKCSSPSSTTQTGSVVTPLHQAVSPPPTPSPSPAARHTADVWNKVDQVTVTHTPSDGSIEQSQVCVCTQLPIKHGLFRIRRSCHGWVLTKDTHHVPREQPTSEGRTRLPKWWEIENVSNEVPPRYGRTKGMTGRKMMKKKKIMMIISWSKYPFST